MIAGILGSAPPLAYPIEYLPKTLVIVRLEKIIERVNLERLQREFIVRGDEHDFRQRRTKRRCHLKSVHLGHLHVEENDIRMQAFDGRDRFRSVVRFANHLEIGRLPQKPQHLSPRRAFIVNQQRPNRHEREPAA